MISHNRLGTTAGVLTAADLAGTLESARLAGIATLLRRQIQLARGRQSLAGLGTAGLLTWARAFLPTHFADPPSRMHRWLEHQLSRAERRRGTKINVVGPRGGAKSTVGTLAWPLRSAVEAREAYIWIVSDSKDQARTHLENIKAELVDNKRLALAYPGAAGRGPTWRAGAIVLRNGVAIEAFGTGQSLRGRRRRAHRPSLIVCDDLQNDRHIQSAHERERSRAWFHGTLLKAGTAKTNILNLATALHRDALALELARTPGWISRLFKAIERWPDDTARWHEWERLYADLDDPERDGHARAFYESQRAQMDAGAVLLWPEREDLYALMCMRVESGRTAFEREKQSAPVNPELCEWPEAYFEELHWFDEWPRRLRVKTMALDPSKGRDARHGDYSALVMLAVDFDGTLYVEADLARRPTPEMMATAVERYRLFRPDAFGVEANQFQELLADSLAAEFARQGLFDAAPWAMTNQVAKPVRIRRLGPYLAQKRIRFKADSPSTQMLVEQLREFPLAAHDDGPDATEMALRLAAEMLSGALAGANSPERLLLES